MLAMAGADESPAAERRGRPLAPEDFTQLYRRHAESLLVYFQRRVFDAEQAADLLAETFAVAIERAGQFRGDDDRSLGAWLWAIARSLVSAAERSGRVEARRTTEFGLERRALERQEIERIEELAEIDLLREQVAFHVERLPPPLRDAVRLRMLEELGYADVARRLGTTEEAARTRVSRGLRLLRHTILRPTDHDVLDDWL
jgi:RNA polymerase sigma-70 factor, ECF subfamily